MLQCGIKYVIFSNVRVNKQSNQGVPSDQPSQTVRTPEEVQNNGFGI